MERTMTRKEDLECIYWDFYKEVHNFRPRHINFAELTEADLEQMLTQLGEQAKVVFAQQAEAEKVAIIRFETSIDALYACGAKTREDALRWIMEASGCDGDWEFLCYENALPYGYFKSVDLCAH